MLREVKSLLRDQLGIPPFVILAIGGGILHLALNAMLRRPLTSPLGLLGPLTFGVALESFEIWSHYHEQGLFAPGNDALIVILMRHALDVAIVLALPLAVVAAGAISAR